MATDSRHNSASQTHSGLPKCDSRPVVSAEPAHHDRVESPPRGSESDIQAVGNSSCEHVCHSPQYTSSPVCVSSSGTLSTGDRCPIIGLAGEVDVHVSTVSPAKQSYSEAQDQSDGRGDTHSPPPPPVPITTVVSTSTILSTPTLLSTTAETSTTLSTPTLLSILPRPAVTTGICLERQVVPSACMEALMQHYQVAGFSREVSKLVAAPRRPSTNRMYDGRWLCFANWATGNGVDPLGPTAAKKPLFCMNFLILMACRLRLSKDTGSV